MCRQVLFDTSLPAEAQNAARMKRAAGLQVLGQIFIDASAAQKAKDEAEGKAGTVDRLAEAMQTMMEKHGGATSDDDEE